jgi:hypothetical protein
MPLGPGKYGARAEQLLREIDAELVAVITIGGSKGASFDVASASRTHLAVLPIVLRQMADSIEADLAATLAAEKPQ